MSYLESIDYSLIAAFTSFCGRMTALPKGIVMKGRVRLHVFSTSASQNGLARSFLHASIPSIKWPVSNLLHSHCAPTFRLVNRPDQYSDFISQKAVALRRRCGLEFRHLCQLADDVCRSRLLA